MEIIDKVWIVTSEIKNDGRVIEGVFNSYKLARMAAEDIWKKIEPPCNSYLWKHKEVGTYNYCIMSIWNTNKNTYEEEYYATIKVLPFPIWH